MAVKGANKVKIGFKKAFDDIRNKKAAKATYAALTVLDQEQALIIPILTSDMANNRTLTINETGERVTGKITFLQSYAAAVHGMAGVNWTRPNSKEQWLFTAAKTARPEIDSEFRKFMKV